MNKPAQIKAIYAELKRVLDPSTSDAEVLRIADALLRHSLFVPDYLAEFGLPGELRALRMLDVDTAMRDGGWRILEFEVRNGLSWEDGVISEHDSLKQAIRHYGTSHEFRS